MNNLTRTIKHIVETDILFSLVDAEGKKAFQLIKYVTGKKTSNLTDYETINTDIHYGFDTITIKGKRGFIRIALEPLFQLIK